MIRDLFDISNRNTKASPGSTSLFEIFGKTKSGGAKRYKAGPDGVLRELRRTERLSQRDLSKRLGISRSHLQRLEAKSWRRLSLAELSLLARGLSMTAEELFQRFETVSLDPISRSSKNTPHFVLQYTAGTQIASYLKRPDKCFIGHIKLDPQKGLTKGQVPKSEFLFFCVQEGNLLLTLLSKEYLFKEGECFQIRGAYPYEIYNSHQFRPQVTLVVAMPSFIRPIR